MNDLPDQVHQATIDTIERVRLEERERIIKSLDIERTGSHALDDLIDTLIFMNISRSDFKRGLIELIKGETNG
jgi:hypothetical protein